MPFEDVVKELVDGPLKMAEDEAKALEPKLDAVKAGLAKVLDTLNQEEGENRARADKFFTEATNAAAKLIAIGGDEIASVAKAIDAATGKTLSELIQAFSDAASKL